MSAWYNDSEPYVVDWMRNLIGAGCIAPGEVDGRSIKDVVAADVRGARQAHFFAGIGVWSYALRLAGWPEPDDDGPVVWTGSCPCQPWSAAGRKQGAEDDRHLWPEWFRLIEERRPDVVLGEQVGSADGLKWLDLVSADLEGAGYTFGAVDSCAASLGAPHQRQRLFFVAYAPESGWVSRWGSRLASDGRAQARLESGRLREARELAHAPSGRTSAAQQWGRLRSTVEGGQARELAYANGERQQGQRLQLRQRGPRADLFEALRHGQAGGVGDTHGSGVGKHAGELSGDEGEHEERASNGDHSSLASGAARLLGDPSGEGLEGRESEPGDDGAQREAVERAGGATGGFWADAEWIYCRDGKWRPVESKYEQVADGLAGDLGRVRAPVWPLSTGELSRVGRIKGYGNAIVAPLAATFIRAFMDVVAADA